MIVRLSELRPGKGAGKTRKRVGRGIGSGKGKTAGRGTKGVKARGQVPVGFEGGQTPLHRRIPQRRGVTNIFKKQYAIVNLDNLAKLEEDVITPELLIKKGVVKQLGSGLRVLGRGEIGRAVTVRAHHFSKAAEEKIKAKGGTTEVV